MTKRLPLPAPLPRSCHRASGPGCPPEPPALSRGAEPEWHPEHFAPRCGAGASSRGQHQPCPLPPALAPLPPRTLRGAVGGTGPSQDPTCPVPALGPVPSARPGGCGRGRGWRLLSRPFPSTTLRTLPLSAVPGHWRCKKKNIPLMSVRLCDPPSVPRPFPLSCLPPLSAARTSVALRLGQGVPGSRCHGATRARDPPPTPPVPGAGAGGEEGAGLLQKAAAEGFSL